MSINVNAKSSSIDVRKPDNVIKPVPKDMQEALDKLTAVVKVGLRRATQAIKEIYEIGKRHNLTKEEIRSHIDFAVGDAYSQRQIRNLLPEELKFTEKRRDQTSKKKLSLPQSQSQDQFAEIISAKSDERVQNQPQTQLVETVSEEDKSQSQSAAIKLIQRPEDYRLEDLLSYTTSAKVDIIKWQASVIQKQESEIARLMKLLESYQTKVQQANKKEQEFVPLAEARKYARENKLTSRDQWREHIKTNLSFPTNIPRRPDNWYGKSWSEFFEK